MQEKANRIEEAPGNSAIRIKATTRRQVEKEGPTRVLEQKPAQIKRYGIDMTSQEVTKWKTHKPPVKYSSAKLRN